MAMTFSDIFAEYYTLYRGDSEVPDTDDPEWTTALRLANNAIRRWQNVDAVYWNELWTSRVLSGTGADSTVGLDDVTYAGPTNMLFPGGYVRITHPTSGAFDDIQLIEPNDVQSQSSLSSYSYWTGGAQGGWTLRLGANDVTSDHASWTIDYPYYKTPTLMTAAGSTPEMSEPAFMVHDMLANRFRASRNWPAYQSARRDADLILANMITRNTAGTWDAPFDMQDKSGGVFGS